MASNDLVVTGPPVGGTRVGEPLARMTGINMSYGSVQVLSGVDFEVGAGEVRALLGENGAGKSTLAKILAGAVPPVAGAVEIGGELLEPKPVAALRLGVRMITQEFSLFPSLTVAENLVTGGEGHRRSLVNWRGIRRQARRYLQQIGLDVDETAMLATLPLAEQQLIEIARALFSGGRLVILDEPTSALGPAESARLFDFVHRMADSGTGFVLITHFLDDVMEHGQRATVLRNGVVAGELEIADSHKRDLVKLMVGDHHLLGEVAAGQNFRLPPQPEEAPVLEVKSIRLAPGIRDVSLEVAPGEVVGVFGDVASGSMQLGDAIFGISKLEGGSVEIDGVPVKNPTQAVRKLALGYVPADRRDALALTLSAATNVTVAQLHSMFGPAVQGSRERRLAGGLIDQLRVKNCTPTSRPGTLSGGNQQKLLLARWLLRPPRVLVLMEPTRGMDLGAKAEVTRLVRQAAAEHGMAVMVVSAEPESVLSSADRIYVVAQGRVVHHFAGCEVSSRSLMAAAHGQIEMELV